MTTTLGATATLCCATTLAVATTVAISGAGAAATAEPDASATAAASAVAETTGVEPTAGDELRIPDQAELERQLDMLLGLVPDAEVQAYYQQLSADYERDIAACMAEAGFEYRPQSNTATAADQATVEWAEQYGFGVFTTMDPDNDPWGAGHDDTNTDYLTTLSDAEANAFWSQQNRCYEETRFPGDQLWNNSEFMRVMEGFWSDVENDPRLIAAQTRWAACMADAGFHYDEQSDVYNDWYSEERWAATSGFWETRAWEPTSPDHADWQALVDEEIEAAVANVTCSADLEETNSEVMASKREELLELWQAVEWNAPPATGPEDEMDQQ